MYVGERRMPVFLEERKRAKAFILIKFLKMNIDSDELGISCLVCWLV